VSVLSPVAVCEEVDDGDTDEAAPGLPAEPAALFVVVEESPSGIFIASESDGDDVVDPVEVVDVVEEVVDAGLVDVGDVVVLDAELDVFEELAEAPAAVCLTAGFLAPTGAFFLTGATPSTIPSPLSSASADEPTAARAAPTVPTTPNASAETRLKPMDRENNARNGLWQIIQV
jgi:hypothetical protein